MFVGTMTGVLFVLCNQLGYDDNYAMHWNRVGAVLAMRCQDVGDE